ncbi:MAG: FKBP-type peptidyl-prolyl cis-trans isomerase [Bacteroidales bacterium]|nr:FKBP-type peptidyl-prolyl cis-trans isomerase [Bacteroidales bacterium]
MKTLILTFSALLITFGLSAQETDKPTNAKQEVILTSSADTLQYALGAYLGQWIVKNSFEVTNANVFLTGMDNVLKNMPLAIPDSTITPIVMAYQLSLQNIRSQQLEESLFANLKEKTGIGALPNGVNYIVVKTGAGIRPNISDTVVFNAKGISPDGTVFEDTYQKEPITNVMSNLIPGLNEAMQLMPVGSVWRVFIPSALAYGSAGLPNVIPPNTALVFDITLIEVREAKK